METILVAALALGLGLVVGSALGARRALNLIVAGRSLRTGAARAAMFMPNTMPQRTASDILAGRIRITLGSTEYVLPVKVRRKAREWLRQLDARFARLAVDLGDAGDDAGAVLARLVAETDTLYDMLLSYDEGGVLPSRDEVDETATDAQILHAVLEVWRAVHPLVASVADASASVPTPTPSSEPPSTPPPPTDGVLTTSTSM